ncbi:MAG: nucleoside-diphosphate kinase [Candidatus Yanofskybacteria bacterium]|nr:nucleoside-diphosphate kinase [Candidatus Yanofskybacteria bacterium]
MEVKTKKNKKVKLERTLVLLKPDTINRGVVGEILQRFERIGAKMIGMKLLVSTKDTAMKHYREDIAERYGQHIRDTMVNMLTSGPVIAVVWEGIGIIEVIRKMVGATYPALAAPGTIRGDFAHVSKDYANSKGIGVFNLIHASATPEEAKIEIDVWFKPEELVQHYPTYTKFTLREDD